MWESVANTWERDIGFEIVRLTTKPWDLASLKLGLGDKGNWESTKVKKFDLNLILTRNTYACNKGYTQNHWI